MENQDTRNNKSSILIIILSVLVVAAIVAGAVTFVTGKTGKKSSSSATPAASSSADSQSVSIIENTNDLEFNKYPEIADLVSNYRQAVLTGDTALLASVFNTDEEINVDILKGTAEIIESYNNTQYYTKDGLAKGEKVVYVFDELKLAGIDTKVPNLSIYYVKTAESGAMYIYRGVYDDQTGSYKYEEDVQNYIEGLYENKDVAQLVDTVNTMIDSACANDPELNEFIERLRRRADVETQTETSTETESETESESESETGTETESETESESAQQ
ncbi:MAG: hypothetical protein K5637_04355 [Lachnospiraceae bacterium]|nr:hypothetical protein [Lachnospiraceae bacterium]